MSNPSRPNVMASVPFDQVANFRKYVTLFDDFIAGDLTIAVTTTGGLLGWLLSQTAGDSGPSVAVHATAADVKGHPGCVVMTIGTTTLAAADEAVLALPGVDSIVLYDPTDALDRSDEHVYVAAIVKFPAVTEVEFNFGLFDAAAVAGRGVNSISVELDQSADAEFNLVVVDGSSATAVATTVTAAIDTWYLFEIVANEDEVQLFINGTLAANTASANIPDDEPLGPAFKLAIEGTTEKTVIIDAFALKVPVDR